MAEPESRSGDVFDVERIRQLVELMKEYDLSEIDLRESEQKIRLARGPQISAGGPAYLPAGPYLAAGMPPIAPPASVGPTPAAAGSMPPPAPPAAPTETEDHLTVIKSPMVGTFYSRPNPNTESFVKVGDHVEPETTVCIIEAMKVFNEIPAEIRGKVVAVLVDDEEPVDFGKPLFKVDTRQ